MRYLRIALHFRHFIRFQTYTRARWVRKLWQYCFKIENRTSTQANFQKTDTRKLSCVFLSSFSARQCKQTYAIFLFASWTGTDSKTSQKSRKRIFRAWLKQFLFLFLFTTFLIVHFYAFLQQFIAGETFKVARIFTTLLIKYVIRSTTARFPQCDSWPLSLICLPVICFINGGVDQYRCEKTPYQYWSNDDPAIMNCATRSHCLELLKNPCK